MEKLFIPDEDVHLTFRRIGRALYVATKGKQRQVCMAVDMLIVTHIHWFPGVDSLTEAGFLVWIP